jgi:hypothetical protein
MRRVCQSLFLLTLILSACSLPAASPPPPLPSPTEAPLVSPTTAVPPDTQNCGYQWAHSDLPELSSDFQESIQALEPGAQASAYAFGENCILPDGSIGRFLPMETDFNVMLPVDDLANEAVLGRWIVRVMEVIESIPADQIAGPRPGRVSILFESSTAQAVINFYIDQYQALPAGLNHEEVYYALQSQQ